MVFGTIGESVRDGTSASVIEVSTERPSLSISVIASSSLLVHEIVGSGSPGTYAARASTVTERFILEAVGTGTVMLFARLRDSRDDGDIEKGIVWLRAWFVGLKRSRLSRTHQRNPCECEFEAMDPE